MKPADTVMRILTGKVSCCFILRLSTLIFPTVEIVLLKWVSFSVVIIVIAEICVGGVQVAGGETAATSLCCGIPRWQRHYCREYFFHQCF